MSTKPSLKPTKKPQLPWLLWWWPLGDIFFWVIVYFYEKWRLQFLQKKNILSNNKFNISCKWLRQYLWKWPHIKVYTIALMEVTSHCEHGNNPSVFCSNLCKNRITCQYHCLSFITRLWFLSLFNSSVCWNATGVAIIWRRTVCMCLQSHLETIWYCNGWK